MPTIVSAGTGGEVGRVTGQDLVDLVAKERRARWDVERLDVDARGDDRRLPGDRAERRQVVLDANPVGAGLSDPRQRGRRDLLARLACGGGDHA
jgi:hypothetical protein